MNNPDNRNVDQIFSEALALPHDKRHGYIVERCQGDQTVEQRVLTLLAAAEAPDDRFADSLGAARHALLHRIAEKNEDAGEDLSGQQIDDWRLIRCLARGGLATVYLAEREGCGFTQNGAFKVLRRGLDTDDLIARFRAERQILSVLDHPSIARILDGGALTDGRPYLVMEFIDGLPITRHCATNTLDLRARIRLLAQVLDALHHAHQRLIVHRDIKPSNILVSREGQVSLLDFGISKLLDTGSLPSATPLTRTGVALLTPGYGSPEQYAGQPVTTASDIYQAGLVAFELITGKRAFPQPLQPGQSEVPLPSRTLSDTRRRREISGDLDAIIGTATREEPARRYGSALDMRDDLVRFLEHRPVTARPDSFAYRCVKLTRRRPWLIPAGTVSILLIVTYLATLTAYNKELEFEKRRAQAAQSFMVNLLQSPDPFAPADPALGSGITVVDALELGVERLKSDAVDDPGLRASLLQSIASVYASLDQHHPAIELAEESLELQQQLSNDANDSILDGLALLASQHQKLGDYESALLYREKELTMARKLFPESHPKVGAAEAGLAALHLARGDSDSSMPLYARAIAKMRPQSAQYSQPLINALVALSGLRNESDPEAAEELLNEARDVAIALFGPDSLSMAMIHAQTGTSASDNQQFEASEAAFQAALEIYRNRLGPRHGATVTAMNNLAVLYTRSGQPDRAENVFRELIETGEQKYGRTHRGVAGHYQNLGTALGLQGRYAEAIPVHRQAYEIFSNTVPDHFMTAYPLISIAYAERQLGDSSASGRTARQALALIEAADGGPYALGVAKCLVALALEAEGATAEGSRLLADAQSELFDLPVAAHYREACRL